MAADQQSGDFAASATTHKGRVNIFDLHPHKGRHIGTFIAGSKSQSEQGFDRDVKAILDGLAAARADGAI